MPQWKRPNVLLLYTDQQRWDALGCAGNPHIRTPNLDALAAEGVLVANAFCNNPVCMPSRQSMLSGQYPSALGCNCNGVEMSPDAPTIHKILKPYGYHTASLGKLHFKNHSNRDHREIHPDYGFDTLIVSDHGEHLGDHGLVQKGPPNHDSCTHVPLILRYPARIAGPVVRDELIELVDLAPTILDYCGVQAPPIFQGRSFRPLLEGRAYERRRSAYVEYHEPFGTSWRTVRTHERKYCVCNDGTELLFDLAADPDELRNLAGREDRRPAQEEMRREPIRRWFDVERQYPLRSGRYRPSPDDPGPSRTRDSRSAF